MNSYQVTLPVYAGHLDLLLELIERQQLEITEVSMAMVTDQYLAYLAQIADHELADLAAFLVVAARLLLMKSEALLPRPAPREADEQGVGEGLVQQVAAYRLAKSIALSLAEREQIGLRAFPRIAPPSVAGSRVELLPLPLPALVRAMQEALGATQGAPPLDLVVAPLRVSIRERIGRIVASLRDAGRITFRRILRDTTTRLEIVVSFLALLELIKQKQVVAEQAEPFGEIELRPGENWRQDLDLDFELEFAE